jgi:L-asparaginase
MSNHITVILTGGTMDGIENPGDEKYKRGSTTQEYLDAMYMYFPYDVVEVCKKDSREVNDEDRTNMLQVIKQAKGDRILIIHGTFTMSQTGQFLKKHIDQIPNKSVMLTGSMIPLEKYAPGDAPFNLGFAIANTLSAGPGVYIAMNAKVFDPEYTQKNIEELRFEESDKPSWLRDKNQTGVTA